MKENMTDDWGTYIFFITITLKNWNALFSEGPHKQFSKKSQNYLVYLNLRFTGGDFDPLTCTAPVWIDFLS